MSDGPKKMMEGYGMSAERFKEMLAEDKCKHLTVSETVNSEYRCFDCGKVFYDYDGSALNHIKIEGRFEGSGPSVQTIPRPTIGKGPGVQDNNEIVDLNLDDLLKNARKSKREWIDILASAYRVHLLNAFDRGGDLPYQGAHGFMKDSLEQFWEALLGFEEKEPK